MCRTPLIIASENGVEDVVHVLVDGGHADLLCKDSEGWTAYDRAEMNAHTSIKKYLGRKEREIQGRSIRDSMDAESDHVNEDDEENSVQDIDRIRPMGSGSMIPTTEDSEDEDKKSSG